MPLGDEHRVLAVEADARAGGGLAVDVLVRVDEHAIRGAEGTPECVELLAQLGVAVVPGVTRQPAVPGRPLGLGQPVAERSRDDAARAIQQALGMARELGPGRRELEDAEEAALAALADVPLRALVGLRRGHADCIEAELDSEPLHVGRRGSHAQRV